MINTFLRIVEAGTVHNQRQLDSSSDFSPLLDIFASTIQKQRDQKTANFRITNQNYGIAHYAYD